MGNSPLKITYRRVRTLVEHAPRDDVAAWLGAGTRVVDILAALRAAGAPRWLVEAATTAQWEDAERLRDDIGAWLEGKRGGGKPRSVRTPAERAYSAARCGRVADMRECYCNNTHYDALGAHWCRERQCLSCARRAAREHLDRWQPLFRAVLRPGYVESFVTIGSLGTVESRADVAAYLRRIGKVVRLMRRGCPAADIAPRSWVAGVRALELRPRPAGAWSHVHLLVVARSFVPFGRAGGSNGLREVLRRVGVGEVVDIEEVRSDTDAPAAYLAKIERYVTKIDGGGATDVPWAGRADIFEALRGARLVQPFGDALGLLAGPDTRTRSAAGADIAVVGRGGQYDPNAPPRYAPLCVREAKLAGIDVATAVKLLGDGADLSVRSTGYVGETLDRWAEWADVARLKDTLTKL